MKPFLLFLFASLSILSVQAKILIATVAQVKSHVITSREIDIHQELTGVLGRRLENFSLEKPQEQVIREWLLYFEASTFYNSKLQDEKVQKNFQLAKQRLAQSQAWKRLDVSDAELKEKLLRRLEAERIFQFKKKASVLPVSLNEIENEYTLNRVRYGNQKFEEVKDKIRQAKVESNLKERMNQWFSVLERKYKVQRFSTFKGLQDGN